MRLERITDTGQQAAHCRIELVQTTRAQGDADSFRRGTYLGVTKVHRSTVKSMRNSAYSEKVGCTTRCTQLGSHIGKVGNVRGTVCKVIDIIHRANLGKVSDDIAKQREILTFVDRKIATGVMALQFRLGTDIGCQCNYAYRRINVRQEVQPVTIREFEIEQYETRQWRCCLAKKCASLFEVALGAHCLHVFDDEAQ
jgi:hypothetical protein